MIKFLWNYFRNYKVVLAAVALYSLKKFQPVVEAESR